MPRKSLKIVIAWPPLPSKKGVPLLSQNRQFQWFNVPTYIYPVIPAYGATLLDQAGYDVIWLDGIAEEMTQAEFVRQLKKIKPDVVFIETKTPVVKRHWAFSKYLKSLPTFKKTKLVIYGDHVTAYPEETLKNSKFDYVLTGGDYDFLMVNFARHLSAGEKLEPGFYWRDRGEIKSTGRFEVKHDLTNLPVINRQLTKWQNYAYKNGNFKFLPGAYTMIGRDCWWRKDGGCKFCSWTSIYPTFRVATPEMMIKEVESLLALGVREIFDDTGTFPIGPWLKKFCELMIAKGYNKRVTISCNMRAKALSKEEYALVGQAGFRFLLYGLESASQNTLDRLNKGAKWDDIKSATQWAKQAGLEPHVTCMIGYPWESQTEAQKTLALTKELFDKGQIDSLQATIVIPYPGTQLFKECEQNDWLVTRDWDKFDMRQPVMTSPIPAQEIHRLTQGLYKSFLTPRFVWRKIKGIRTKEDIRFLWIAAWRVLGHLKDFISKPKPIESTQPSEEW